MVEDENCGCKRNRLLEISRKFDKAFQITPIKVESIECFIVI